MSEALEEGGVEIDEVQYIGCYQISERQEVRWADVYTARSVKLVEITMTEESLGRQLVGLEELPTVYHLWTPLTEMVFQHAAKSWKDRCARSARLARLADSGVDVRFNLGRLPRDDRNTSRCPSGFHRPRIRGDLKYRIRPAESERRNRR